MTMMSGYCKAYYVKQFREFDGWVEAAENLDTTDTDRGPRTALADDDYLFLHDTFVVTDGIFMDENVIFEDVSPAWKEFCTDRLAFSVPDVLPSAVDDGPHPSAPSKSGAGS